MPVGERRDHELRIIQCGNKSIAENLRHTHNKDRRNKRHHIAQQGQWDFIIQTSLTLRSKEDTLLLRFSNAAGQFATDTIFVLHDGQPHFESADCPLVVFHKLNSVRWTTHAMKTMPLAIDSIAIIKENVTYDNAQNLKIYLRSVVTQ